VSGRDSETAALRLEIEELRRRLAESEAALAAAPDRVDVALEVPRTPPMLLGVALKQARDSESRLSAIFRANLIGLVLEDAERRILYANDEYLRITGCSREDLEAGRINAADLTAPGFRALDRERSLGAFKQGVCRPYEKQYIRKDGTCV